ncbi:MAG: [FeFe] hydrogenase H-cluster radical SAM maturase HydE [Coprococcus sp.]
MNRDMLREMIDRIYEYGQSGADASKSEQGRMGVCVGDKIELAEFISDLFHAENAGLVEYMRCLAYKVSHEIFENKIYTRGLIECTNICKNNCYYCGIRKDNHSIERYRLDKEDILTCCREGYRLGFRTFVLQGGEDGIYTPEFVADIVCCIKKLYDDCAVTLSFGEQEYNTYRLWRTAGADRYLLRHETADKEHYEKLHPAGMSYEHRIKCLYQLKELGYQVGSGFMVGSPYQKAEHLACDLIFLSELKPHMIGIGPYIPHKDTPFAGMTAGSLKQTLIMISLLRLMFPNALIPATTSLGTIAPDGREQGFLYGANVVMPNLSPVSVRKKYMLYDNKICTGEESAQCRACLDSRVKAVGYELTEDRGDYMPLALDNVKCT